MERIISEKEAKIICCCVRRLVGANWDGMGKIEKMCLDDDVFSLGKRWDALQLFIAFGVLPLSSLLLFVRWFDHWSWRGSGEGEIK